jgi:Ca2+-binding EF-hand superfamily protein
MYGNVSGGGKLDRLSFLEMMHSTFDITDDVMLDRIFRALDGNNDGLVKNEIRVLVILGDLRINEFCFSK